MIRRVLALLGLVWALGFVAFAVTLPRAADDRRTDAIVVLTGANGRIARGAALLEAGRAARMLISGVDRGVPPGELAAAQGIPRHLVACCVDIGRAAVDTRSNGAETARWIATRNYRSIRLVTSGWHMPRAQFELGRSLGPGVSILPDAVSGDASFALLFREYHKFIARRLAGLAGL